MKRALVFRHVPHEGLGTLEPFFEKSKVNIEYCDLFTGDPISDDLERYDMIISMGGPMNADETDRYPFLLDERETIKEAIRLKLPVFGICLGSQIIARALGANVYPGPKKEIGWFPIHLKEEAKKDPVFSAFKEKDPVVFHWHGDTFDLPKGAVLLASSDLYPNQAFRFDQHVYAFQFHIEVTASMIQDWILKGPEELEQVKTYVSADKMLKDTEKNISGLGQNAENVYARLLRKYDMISA